MKIIIYRKPGEFIPYPHLVIKERYGLNLIVVGWIVTALVTMTLFYSKFLKVPQELWPLYYKIFAWTTFIGWLLLIAIWILECIIRKVKN